MRITGSRRLKLAMLSREPSRFGSFASARWPYNISCFGCDGDKDAALIYMDGSYLLRDRGFFVTFGYHTLNKGVKWTLSEGYLPCFISEFQSGSLKYKITDFADKLVIGGHDFSVAYSRVEVTNLASFTAELSAPDKRLARLGSEQLTVKPKATVVNDYAVFADRFGGAYKYPEDSLLSALGGFDEHYSRMKNYWLKKLSAIAHIKNLPCPELINAYKAGYIFTHIVKDADKLHVGENGYDRIFDHDVIDILSTLVILGDTNDFEAYCSHILDNVQYCDARWKYSLPFQKYLERTGDTELVIRHFPDIRKNTHYIEKQRGKNGIMRLTDAIDSNGFWTVDNWAALTGLAAYSVICDRLYEKTNDSEYIFEKKWAKALYDSLFSCTDKVISNTVNVHSLDYIPVSAIEPNSKNRCINPTDANWASMFLFGAWAWEGRLLGAKQGGIQISKIDDTYDYGFGRLKAAGLPEHTFGGFPGICSAYNAGYGSAALRGERHRDIGINAYMYSLRHTKSAPYSWWENITDTEQLHPYAPNAVSEGGGSCPHMWGQALATRVLLDSLIACCADGTIIIGRGIPSDWLEKGDIEISNYLTPFGRFCFTINETGKSVSFKFNGKHKEIKLELPCFVNNIESAEGLEFDNLSGIVSVPYDTSKVTVTLKRG